MRSMKEIERARLELEGGIRLKVGKHEIKAVLAVLQ
jgi:hypothetical protein